MASRCHRCPWLRLGAARNLAHQTTDDSQKAQTTCGNLFVLFVLFRGRFRANAGSDESGSTLMVGQAHNQSCQVVGTWLKSSRGESNLYESRIACFESLRGYFR